MLSKIIKYSAAKIHLWQIKRQIVINNKPLLEIGYGEGFLMAELGRFTKKVYGIDIKKPLTVRNRLISVTTADACHLPFGDRIFGIVLCCHSLEHMRDLGQVLSEVSRVTCPAGYFVVIYPYEPIRGLTLIGNINTWPCPGQDHLHQFTPSRLNRIVLKYGFVPVRHNLYFGYNPMFISVFKRIKV